MRWDLYNGVIDDVLNALNAVEVKGYANAERILDSGKKLTALKEFLAQDKKKLDEEKEAAE